jgi:hypothetical protein
MELKVKFKSKNGRAIDLPSRNVGLDAVNEARYEAGLNLPLDIIYDYVMGAWKNPEITIEEELAVTSGHFGETSRRDVIVEEGFLNKFVNIRNTLLKDRKTGTVKKVSFYYKVDETAVLEAWEEAGFPLEWGAEEE